MLLFILDALVLDKQWRKKVMADAFHLNIPSVSVDKSRSYQEVLDNADPEAMENGRCLYPNQPLETQPGDGFQATRNILAVLP